jgi:hypothetical protein
MSAQLSHTSESPRLSHLPPSASPFGVLVSFSPVVQSEIIVKGLVEHELGPRERLDRFRFHCGLPGACDNLGDGGGVPFSAHRVGVGRRRRQSGRAC